MSRLELLGELGGFLKARRKWWLAPMVVVLVLLGVIIVLAESSALAPFIYSLF